MAREQGGIGVGSAFEVTSSVPLLANGEFLTEADLLLPQLRHPSWPLRVVATGKRYYIKELALCFAADGVTPATAADWGTRLEHYELQGAGSQPVDPGAGGPESTDQLPEGATNLYFTTARVLATNLAGYAKAGAVAPIAATDTLLQALGKLEAAVAAAGAGAGTPGAAGRSVLVGYADNPAGANPSSSAKGKKFRAEYVPAADDPNPTTFTPALAAGKWVRFSLERLSGVHVAPVVDMNIDNQSAADQAGPWLINEFTNVVSGASVRIRRKSLNNVYVAGTNTVRVGVDGSGSPTGNLRQVVGVNVTRPFSEFLPAGTLVRIGGVVRRVQGVDANSFVVSDDWPATVATTAAWEFVQPDTLQLPAGSCKINGATTAGNLVINGPFGAFIEGALNVLRWECVGITGTEAAPVYEFDLFITN